MPYPAKTSREAIVGAALALLERDGPDALTMRALAETLSVRASSLYRHVPDRDALLSALADEAACRLHDAMRAASHDQRGPEAFHAAAHAYLAFSRERPRLYDLLHAPRAPEFARPGPRKDLWNFVLALTREITSRPDDTSGAVAVWAFLHGFCALERSGSFGLSGPKEGFERGLAALRTGL